MPTVRTLKVYPTERIPALQQGTDRDSVPFRWLESLVADIKRAIPDEAEQKTCKVHGVSHLTATYEHTLSPAEEAQEQMNELAKALAEIRAALPPQGTSLNLSPEQVEQLRQSLARF